MIYSCFVLLVVKVMSTPLDIFHQLKNILGLNDKDIEIYRDLFQFGPSAASTIAARTRIDRTTVYAVLKRLINKGVIVKTIKNETSIFVALKPNVFEQQLRNDIAIQEKKLNSLQDLIPQLLSFQQESGSRPTIQIFEGPSSITSLYEQLLHSSKKQDAFLTIEKLPSTLKNYLIKDYIEQKLRLKVKSRVLVEDSQRAQQYKLLDQKANRQTKLLPKGDFPFETEIIIGENDEVAIIDFRQELIGVFIKSSSIRKTLKRIFDLLWAAY